MDIDEARKMTRTKTMETPWRLHLTALALGIAIGLLGASVAFSATVSPTQGQAAAPTAPTPSWAQGFVCNAKPGGWCDLRDWRGFAEPVPQQATAPAR
jgi:hypothetical protein